MDVEAALPPQPLDLEEVMYDAIVVGARVAGSPTALLLARKGYRVLAVDRATFPSDTLSTHILHAPGVAALKRWGLLDELVATGCPAIEQYTFDFGPVVISWHQPGRRGQPHGVLPAPYRPRRDPGERRPRCRRRGARGLQRRRGAGRGRAGRRHPERGPRGPRPDRHRRRRPQQPCRQGRRRGGVQHQAAAAVQLLHLLQQPAHGRDGDLHPARPRVRRAPRRTTD